MERIKKAYAENGDLKIIPDTPPLDGSENWEQGRGAYYELDNDPNTGDPLALDIDREQDNYFKNVISKNIKHWQENSYPIYFEDIKYPKNATVRYTDGNVYVSKVDNNTALPTDTDNWVNFEDFGTININTLPNKATPDDTDNLVLQETGGDLKKVSFENLTKLNPNDSRVKTALNASGEAPIYAYRAWVNFNGTTTPPTIRASGNVSSVVRSATGIYVVNFTTPMPDLNYSVIGTAGGGSGSVVGGDILTQNVSVYERTIAVFSTANGGPINASFVNVAFFR